MALWLFYLFAYYFFRYLFRVQVSDTYIMNHSILYIGILDLKIVKFCTSAGSANTVKSAGDTFRIILIHVTQDMNYRINLCKVKQVSKLSLFWHDVLISDIFFVYSPKNCTFYRLKYRCEPKRVTRKKFTKSVLVWLDNWHYLFLHGDFYDVYY